MVTLGGPIPHGEQGPPAYVTGVKFSSYHMDNRGILHAPLVSDFLHRYDSDKA